MENALKRQQTTNENEGLSMKELFEKKRLEAEKAVEGKAVPGKESIEDRKARLQAQRDLLRKQKEEKR